MGQLAYWSPLARASCEMLDAQPLAASWIGPPSRVRAARGHPVEISAPLQGIADFSLLPGRRVLTSARTARTA